MGKPRFQPVANPGRSLALILVVLVALLVLVNIPINDYGIGLAHFAPAQPATVVREGMLFQGDSSEIYLLEDHRLRLISSTEAYNLYFRRGPINRVEDRLLDQFATGPPIRYWLTCGDSSLVYARENGQKRLCPDGCGRQALQTNPLQPWDKVHLISCEELDRLPNGPPLAGGTAELASKFHYLWWPAGAAALLLGGWFSWRRFAVRPELSGRDETLQTYVDQALNYRNRLDQLLLATSNKSNGHHRQQLSNQLNTWIEAIEKLIQRIAVLRQDDLIRHDLVEAPQAIQTLEARLACETDPVIRTQLQQALSNRKNQVASLKALESSLKRAEVLIENTLSLLGTMYSQLLIDQSTHHVVDYGRLSANLNEAVCQLQDQLDALQEVTK